MNLSDTKNFKKQNNNTLQATETPPTSPSLRGIDHKLRLLSNNGLLESTPSQDDLAGVKDAAGSIAMEGGIGEWRVRPEEMDVVSPCTHRSRARTAIRKQRWRIFVWKTQLQAFHSGIHCARLGVCVCVCVWCVLMQCGVVWSVCVCVCMRACT